MRNWPNLRGPFGQGIAHHVTPPIDFDAAAGKNVRWKTPIPKPGASSPVVWEGRVFLTGADKNAREIYCFDAANGKMLWRHSARQPAHMPKVSEEFGHAAATGATDGKFFFAIFSTGDLGGGRHAGYDCLDAGRSALPRATMATPRRSSPISTCSCRSTTAGGGAASTRWRPSPGRRSGRSSARSGDER